MQPADLLKVAFSVMIMAPVIAAVLAFTGEAAVRKIARTVLALAWLSCAAAILACIWLSGRPSSGIGSGVFLLIAVAPALLGFIWWKIWLAARRHDYVRSLPPDLRRAEELSDIEEGIEQMSRDLARAERRVDSWLISSEERARLRFQISILRPSLDKLKEERDKRRRAPAASSG